MNVIQAPTTYSNPVVIVVPQTAIPNDKTPQAVTLHYVVATQTNSVCIVDSTGNALIPKAISVQATMHARGQATLANPKHQYAVKLSDEPSDGSHFLDMPGKGKDWVFNDCGAVDPTLIRNPLAFKMQNTLGQYAPAYKYFEMFLCQPGTDVTKDMKTILSKYYVGTYLNFDKIEFSSSRVQGDYHKKDIDGSHGILQLNPVPTPVPPTPKDPNPIPEYLYLSPNLVVTGTVLVYEPKFKKFNTNQNAIDSFMNWYGQSGANNWGGNFANAYNNVHFNGGTKAQVDWATIRNNTDYQSFAVYFLLNELAKDPDGYHKSTFMVKRNNKCYAGPLWDKNKSFGNTAVLQGQNYYTDPVGWLYNCTPDQASVWWHVMLWDTQFCETVWNVWTSATQTGGVLTTTWLHGFVNEQLNYLTNTGMLHRDSETWPNDSTNANPFPPDPSSPYYAQITQLNNYLQQRITFMTANLATLLNSTSGFTPPKS